MLWLYFVLFIQWGTRWRSWLRHCDTSRKFARLNPDGGHWNSSLTESFFPHYGPVVDSASKRNEYQECFLEDTVGRYIGLTNLTLSFAECLEICET
jgi:hypothetical protein